MRAERLVFRPPAVRKTTKKQQRKLHCWSPAQFCSFTELHSAAGVCRVEASGGQRCSGVCVCVDMLWCICTGSTKHVNVIPQSTSLPDFFGYKYNKKNIFPLFPSLQRGGSAGTCFLFSFLNNKLAECETAAIKLPCITLVPKLLCFIFALLEGGNSRPAADC